MDTIACACNARETLQNAPSPPLIGAPLGRKMRLASALRCLAALAVLAAAAAQYGFDLAAVQRSVSTQTARSSARARLPLSRLMTC